jgi:hypothetical protein
MHKENPIADGDPVIPKKVAGGYTVAYVERGNIPDAQDFPDREVHVEFLIDKLYALYFLNKRPNRMQVSI